MAISNQIIQTYKTNNLPWLTKWHIFNLKRNNPQFDYRFFDDAAVANYIKSQFPKDIFSIYQRLNIGAAKADFFRYAFLLKEGGVYLDIDSRFLSPINNIVLPNDTAVIAKEGHGVYYVQWALFYEAKHPFLSETLNHVCENIDNNKFHNDVHRVTGPGAYTFAINNQLKKDAATPFRELPADYAPHLQFSYPGSKLFLYGFGRKLHWKKQSKLVNLLKPNT